MFNNMYIDGYTNIIDVVQKAALDHFMAGDMLGNAISGSRLFQPYYVDVAKAREYKEILDSTRYNNMQISLGADLTTLFSHANYIDNILRNIKNQSVSSIENINNQIINAYNAMDKKLFEIIRNILGFKHIFYDSFRDNSNMEAAENPLYTGYYKTVSHDNYNHRLVMPSKNLFDYTRDAYGKRMVNIDILDRRGVTIGPVNALYSPEYAIDNSDDSYWAELIINDSQLDAGYVSDFNFKDNVPYGAVSVLRINLRGFKKYNELRIKPFCEFPIYIVGVYAVNISADNKMNLVRYIMSHYESGDYYVHPPQWINETTSYNFAPVSSNAILIILAQPHYKRSSFRLPKGKRENYEIFNTIFAKNAFGVIDYSKFDTDDDLMTTNNNIAKTMIRESEIDTLHVYSQDNTVEEFNKLEYSLGAYDISIKYNTYDNISEYISKPLRSITSIGQISLWADATAIGPHGHIEYSVLIGENSFEVPIMPLNDNSIYEYINNSRVFTVSNKTYYKLRFQLWSGYYTIISSIDPTQKRTMYYKQISNVTMDGNDIACIDITGIDTTTCQCTLKYPYKSTNNVVRSSMAQQINYGTKYPADIAAYNGYHPQYVDLLHNSIRSQMVLVEESITDFDKATLSVSLKNTPFMQYTTNANTDYNTNSDVPIIVTINNTIIQYFNYNSETIDIVNTVPQYIEGKSSKTRPYTYNKTDYKTRNPVYLQSYRGVGADKNGTPTMGSQYLLEYQVIGNKIYFNYDLSGSTIVVRYSKLTDLIRFKATIISTTPGHGDCPPYLNSYALLMNDFNNTSSYEYDTEEYGIVKEDTSTGTEINIRPVNNASDTYSDEYVTVSMDNFKMSSVTPDIRRFRIINSGNTTVKYRFYVRATVTSHNDPMKDSYYACYLYLIDKDANPFNVLGQGHIGAGKVFTFNASNGVGYPSTTMWYPTPNDIPEGQVGDGWDPKTFNPNVAETFGPGIEMDFVINMRLHSKDFKTQMTDSIIMMEFIVEATPIDVGATTGEEINNSKCFRNGPTYYIKYKCDDSISALAV